LISFGRVSRIAGSFSRILLTSSSVLAPADFRIGITTARLSFACTMLVCGANPSRTLATSRT
jgi:hypothetical protein